MATFFDNMKKSFVDVPTEPGINTVDYCNAAESLVGLFDILGPTAFAAVISDMNGNIKKIRARHEACPDKCATIQDLCKNEIAEGKHDATQGVLWLNRGLNFTCLALEQNVAKPDEELTASFNDSYGSTLKPHHNLLVKGVFSLALKAVPYRKDFYSQLGGDQEKVKSQLDHWLRALNGIVGITNNMFDAEKDTWKWAKW